MKYDKQQRKTIIAESIGKKITALYYEKDGEYWVYGFADGSESSFRFMAEIAPQYSKDQAIQTMKSSMITAFWKTSTITGLTIDKSSELQDKLIEELFHPSVRWAVETYLEKLKEGEK